MGDARRLWIDQQARREALEAIIAAWEEGSPSLDQQVSRIDTAVVAGLRALGLPRAPVRGVRLAALGMRSAGRKAPDCRLFLNADALRAIIRGQQHPDSAFCTWIHESLHARQPYAPTAAAEYVAHRGYEEGQVEGLARLVTGERAAMQGVERTRSYECYVVAYRTLAAAVGVAAERLWRALWAYPTGAVRAGFVRTISAVSDAAMARAIPASRGGVLQAVADQMFASARQVDRPSMDAMLTTWRMALP